MAGNGTKVVVPLTPAADIPRPHRGTICCVDAVVRAQAEWPGEQYVLRLQAPEIAERATPGSFVHIRCSPAIPMRRPLSILRADPGTGEVEVLYKVVGQGLAALRRVKSGDRVNLLGPIGNGFRPDPDRPVALLIGGGVGVPPLVFLAERLARSGNGASAVAFFGSELPFPFELSSSQLPLKGVVLDSAATLRQLEEWGVPARLASNANLPGCFRGFVTELAGQWLEGLAADELDRITIYACGPTPMLRATQALAREFGLPTQLCLEEFMACAVGGCAGCVVPVIANGQRTMKRVCVDGPVFDGALVYPETA